MNSKKLIVFLFLLSCTLSFSQESLVYTYDNGDKKEYLDYFEKITKNQKKSVDGDYRGQRKDVYEKQLIGLVNKFNDSTYIFNDELSLKIKGVFDEIYRTNPELNDPSFRFLFQTNVIPNAAAYGNGLFEINLGLLSFFETEDEIAFVICHELAHYYMLHIQKNVDNYIEKLNSKDLKEEAKTIKKMEYGGGKAGVEFLKKLSFELSSYSRETELEADAKGFEYFSRTKYNHKVACKAIEKLGKLEEIIFEYKIDWHKIFDRNDYVFKEYLIEEEGMSLFDSDEVIDDYKWDKDSLRSHPNTGLRIQHLACSSYDESEQVYKIQGLNNLSRKLSALAAIDKNRLHLAIYLIAINMDVDQKEEQFYVARMSQVLQRIYELKKDHKLGKYVPQESSLSDEIYLNEIIRFINNIDLSELKKLGQKYTQFYHDSLSDNHIFMQSFEIFNK